MSLQCVEQLTEVQAGLQESVKDLSKSRKKYQETEVLAQAVREKAELEAKYASPPLLLLLLRPDRHAAQAHEEFLTIRRIVLQTPRLTPNQTPTPRPQQPFDISRWAARELTDCRSAC